MMTAKRKEFFKGLFSFVLIIFSILFYFQAEVLYASESDNSEFITKVSKAYTKKFCNSIGFGLSKESAMNFSIKENNQAFKKRKEMKSINKDLLSEKIAISVIEKCGYPINLSGEEGIQEFKSYYLAKDKEYS